MTNLTAIDILIEPDATAIARATAINERLRTSYPAGFALDESHRPHITLLQRYVRTSAIEEVFLAVARISQTITGQLSFRAAGIRHMPIEADPGLGIAAIVVAPGAEVIDLQSALIEVLRPFTGSGGTPESFETTAQEPGINDDTLAYVERYVPDHSGANYVAHITAGVAPLEVLSHIEAEPFDAFTFHQSAIGIYKLGNNGTARRKLKSWPEM